MGMQATLVGPPSGWVRLERDRTPRLRPPCGQNTVLNGFCYFLSFFFVFLCIFLSFSIFFCIFFVFFLSFSSSFSFRGPGSGTVRSVLNSFY